MRPLLALSTLSLLAASAFAQAPAAAPAPKPGLYATLTTSMGPIRVELFEKEAPLTVKNFVDLATGAKSWKDPRTKQTVKKPLYNGTIFHRVIPGFMIQGGDPLGTGTGDAGYEFKDEFAPGIKFDKAGRLAMANSGPNTNSCQFFITEAPTPHLNNLHSIFGQVIEGQDLVSRIARVPKDRNDKPRTPVILQTVKIERIGPDGKPAPVSSTTTAAPKPAPKKAAAPSKKQ
jgi:peptidyl-prolyl cis-trans isomerase A (cyclophilin A)